MLVIDAVRRAIRGVSPEPEKGVSPWVLVAGLLALAVVLATLLPALWG